MFISIWVLFDNKDNEPIESCNNVINTYQKIFEHIDAIGEKTASAFFNFAKSLSSEEDNIISCNLLSYLRIHDDYYKVDIRCCDSKSRDDVYFTSKVYSKDKSLYYIKGSTIQGCESDLKDTYIEDIQDTSDFLNKLTTNSFKEEDLDISTKWFLVDQSKFHNESNVGDNYIISKSDEEHFKTLGFEELCLDCQIGPILAYVKYNDEYYIKTTTMNSDKVDTPGFLDDKNFPGFPEQLEELRSLFNQSSSIVLEDENGIIFSDYCWMKYPNEDGKKNYYISISNIGDCLEVN